MSGSARVDSRRASVRHSRAVSDRVPHGHVLSSGDPRRRRSRLTSHALTEPTDRVPYPEGERMAGNSLYTIIGVILLIVVIILLLRVV